MLWRYEYCLYRMNHGGLAHNSTIFVHFTVKFGNFEIYWRFWLEIGHEAYLSKDSMQRDPRYLYATF